jgi:hypothetical protein
VSYNKYDFPIINEVGGCRLKSKEVEQDGLSKPSTPPVQYTDIEIDLMDVLKQCLKNNNPSNEEKTKWLLCLRTIFMCDYWKDFIESVGRGSTKTYKEEIDILKSKIKKLEEGSIPRTDSGGSPVKKQKRSQVANDIDEQIDKLNTTKQRLEQLEATEKEKNLKYTRNSQTNSLKITATEPNVKRQKKIIINEFKNAVRFIVNEISGKKLDNDQSFEYFYNLLNASK